jgi:hypothetical protein
LTGKSVDDVQQSANSLDESSSLGSPDGPDDRLDRVANVTVGMVDNSGSYEWRSRSTTESGVDVWNDRQRTDDNEEEAQQHGTRTDNRSGLCVAKSSNERSDVHDDQQDYSPQGGTDGVSERIDGGCTGVQMETHDEHVVQRQTDEAEKREGLNEEAVSTTSSERLSARLTQRSKRSCFLHTEYRQHRRYP